MHSWCCGVVQSMPCQFCGVLFTDHKNDLDLGGERLRCAATVSDEAAPVSTNPEVSSQLPLTFLRLWPERWTHVTQMFNI